MTVQDLTGRPETNWNVFWEGLGSDTHLIDNLIPEAEGKEGN